VFLEGKIKKAQAFCRDLTTLSLRKFLTISRVEGYAFRDFLTFAACLPSAVRVFFGKCFNVCFRFAALIAFRIFFLAALRCFPLAITTPF
jgi:hypothetical protein